MNKKLLSLLALPMLFSSGVYSAVIRVNNDTGAAAQYSNITDALRAAIEGDVIILDPSTVSYGDMTLEIPVTIQGSGYFKEANEPTQTGNSPSMVGKVTIKSPGVKLCGLQTDNIDVLASDVVINRCYVSNINLSDTYHDIGTISNVIIHQNFISGSIIGNQYGTKPSQCQISNNIFKFNTSGISNVINSVVEYNSFAWDDNHRSAFGLTNSVISHNIGGMPELSSNTNTISDNFAHSVDNPYGNMGQLYSLTDAKVKEVDTAVTTEYGAFAGDDPYRLSGLPAGPVIESLSVPASVEKGQPLEVVIKIGVAK